MRIDSTYRPHAVAVAQTLDGLRSGRLSRREMLRLVGGAGLATAGLLALGRRGASGQEGTPPPMVMPQVGPQADGSTLWHVKVGDMKMEQKSEIHAFLPGDITVAVGDSIWFDMMMPGFHTVTFTAGGEVPPIFIPDPEAGTPVAGGLPKLILNPLVVFGTDGGDFDGTAIMNSGVDVFRDPTKPFIVRFTAAGSFEYYCIPHAPLMTAKVNVVEAGTALPMDQAGYDAAVAAEIETHYQAAEAVTAQYAQATETKRDDGTSLWEATVGAGEWPVRVQAFLPETLTIKAGDTVKWVNRAPGEPHTVSFVGAGETPPEDTIVEAFADGSPKFVQSMETFLPQGGNVWDGTGFINSGFTGIAALGLPMEWECTFTTAGDYTPYCILHGDSEGTGMAGKLTVTSA
jgi:plastocyanin